MNPSGQQTELRYSDQRAVVVEVGGGVRCYDIAGRRVLDGYGDDEMVTAARGQPLIPWPNRLHSGKYVWDGEEHVVPVDEPEQNNALHGLTRWRSWSAADVSESAVTMHLRLLPQPAYPFALHLHVRYELGPDGLVVTTTATNIGDGDAPYGHGAHPYLAVGDDVVDDAVLHLPARTWLPTGPAQIPIGREPVEGTPYDFTSPRAIGRVHVDYTFADLERDENGTAWVSFTPPRGDEVQLWLDDHFPYVELFTGDTLPESQRRRRSLGLEPMTCPPDAFRTGENLLRLPPGDSVTTQWGVRPSA